MHIIFPLFFRSRFVLIFSLLFRFHQNTLLMCGYVYFLCGIQQIFTTVLWKHEKACDSEIEREGGIYTCICTRNHLFIVTPQVFALTFYYARICGHCVRVTEKEETRQREREKARERVKKARCELQKWKSLRTPNVRKHSRERWRYMEKSNEHGCSLFTYIFKLSKCSDRCFYAKMNIPFKLSILNAASHIDHYMFSRWYHYPRTIRQTLDTHRHTHPYYELKIEIFGGLYMGSWSAIQRTPNHWMNFNNGIDGNDSSCNSGSQNGVWLST